MSNRVRTILIVLLVGAALAGGVAWQRGLDARSVDAEVEGRDAHSRTVRSHRRAHADDPESGRATPPYDPRVGPQPDPIAAELRAPLVLTGTVTEATGSPPEREQASCRLGIDRTDDPASCRVVLECGHTRLHGAPVLHETPCAFDAAALSALADPSTSRSDHDPSLTFDPATRTLSVHDDSTGFYGEYSLVLALDDP